MRKLLISAETGALGEDIGVTVEVTEEFWGRIDYRESSYLYLKQQLADAIIARLDAKRKITYTTYRPEEE